MKNKFLTIKTEDIEGSFDLKIEPAKTIPFVRKFIEFKGKKYICTKIGNEEWSVQEVDQFPFVELPKDFFTVISQFV